MFWKSREFKLVLRAIRSRKGLYLGIAAALISAGIAATIPYIYGRLVDIAISSHTAVDAILKLILTWLILSLINNLLGWYSDKKAYEAAVEVQDHLITDLFMHLLSLPMQFHKERKIGRILERIERGINDVSNLIEQTVFDFLPSAVTFLVALIILLFVEWRLASILLFSSALYILITLFHTKNILKNQKIMHRKWEKAYGELWDSVLNVEAVKYSTNEAYEEKKNRKSFGIAEKFYKRWRLLWLYMNTWQGFIFSLSFVAVFSVGVFMLRAGSLTPGKLIMFVGYTSLLTAPLSRLAQQYRMTRSALFNFGRAAKYFDLTPEGDVASAVPLDNLKGEIKFEKVSFGYKRDIQTLTGLNFEARSGETIALVGESGVGKSSFVGLIGRYYFPQKGRILIDGVDIRKIKLKSLRKQIAIVPQEVLLFNDTILNNIKYGRIGASDVEVVAAAKAANAHEFIENFPKKYNQLVGERGIKLSTGQKQRVAIARAILRSPKILILDEATSALDSASEKLVQEALSKLIKGRTTFIIAHRLSTIQHADKIIVLENGKIAEIGNHVELMENPEGIYRNFWEMQTAIAKAK